MHNGVALLYFLLLCTNIISKTGRCLFENQHNMTKVVLPENLPQHLDLNDWIQLALHSEDETSRQIALEELASTGVAPYMQGRIREISSRDPSSVCRQLAAWVEALDRARTELKTQLKGLEVTPEAVKQLLSSQDSARATVITQLLRKAPGEETMKLWRNILAAEKNPRMLEIALTLLAKFGIDSDADHAPIFLLETDADLVCAALTLLQQRDVASFKKQIRHGLTSRSFKVQLHAVHLLRMVDCDEAIKYIEAFLFHKNALIRQKALRELMLVTFDKVENLCLQYLGREVQPLLLVKAGFVAAFNPSADFPLKLYDIMTLANGYKMHILQLILRQSIEAIKAAGILQQSVEAYMADLKQKIMFRKSEQVIRCAIRDLSHKDAALRFSAVDRLGIYCEYPSIRTTLQKHLEIETDAEIIAIIEVLIGEDKIKPVVAKTRVVDPQNFLSLSIKEQRSQIVAIRNDESYSSSRQLLLTLLQLDLKKNIVLEILKIINRFGSRIDSAIVVAMVEDKDSSVAAQAIKTMGKIDIDAILPHLNRYLAHDDPRIKAAALEVYLIADKEGAVQYLSSILRSASVTTRRIGLSLLPQLDYPSAEPLLWNRLKHEANGELKIQAGYMVAANPTREGLNKLFAFTHDKNGLSKPGYDEIWKLALISAESAFHKTTEEMEMECWEAYKADHEQVSEEKSAYAYKTVVGESDYLTEPLDDNNSKVEKFFLHLSEFKWHYLIGFFAITPFLWNMMSGSNPSSSARRPAGFAGARTSFLATESGVDKKTQVGTSDWQGALKTGARGVLSGSAYSQAITSGRQETERFLADHEKDYRQHMLDLANDPAETEEVRMLAAANLHAAYAQASKAWEQGNFSEAEMFFEKAVEDPQLNSYGRCVAIQRLAELAETRKDKVSWVKWQDRLLKELKSMPGYQDILGFENFASTFGKMLEVSRSLSGGGSADSILDGLKGQGESDDLARRNVETLKDMDSQFQKFFSDNQ